MILQEYTPSNRSPHGYIVVKCTNFDECGEYVEGREDFILNPNILLKCFNCKQARKRRAALMRSRKISTERKLATKKKRG